MIERSRRNPPHVSDVPKRQFFVKGTELAIIFQWTCCGSGVDKYVSREESCWAPSMLCAFGENGGLEDSLDEPYAILSDVGDREVDFGSEERGWAVGELEVCCVCVWARRGTTWYWWVDGDVVVDEGV
jgi:hypothetical protein